MKLFAELLREFEQEAVRVGFLADLGMEDGLSDDELDALEARCQITLPDELRTLYRWKSGLQPGVNLGAPESMLLHGGFHVANVAKAEYLYRDGYTASSVKEDLEQFETDPQAVAWLAPRIPYLWTPFNDGFGSYLLADMSGGSSAPCPIIRAYKDWESDSSVFPLVYHSLSAMVRSAVACLEAGLCRVEDGEMTYDSNKADVIIAGLNPEIVFWRHRVDERKSHLKQRGNPH